MAVSPHSRRPAKGSLAEVSEVTSNDEKDLDRVERRPARRTDPADGPIERSVNVNPLQVGQRVCLHNGEL